MFLRISLLVGGLLTVMFVGSYFMADPGRSEVPTQSETLRLFDSVAFSGFGNEGPKGQGPVLRRWTGTVRIALIGEPSDMPTDGPSWRAGVEAMAEIYDSIKGLDVAVVDEVSYEDRQSATMDANFRIVLVPSSALNDLMDSGVLPPSVAQALTGREGCDMVGADTSVLADVTLFMRANLSASARNQCLGEWLAKGLGFTIEEKSVDTVFRVDPTGLRFHPLGRMAAALVYDPALRPGMSREEGLAVAATVLAEKGVPKERPAK